MKKKIQKLKKWIFFFIFLKMTKKNSKIKKMNFFFHFFKKWPKNEKNEKKNSKIKKSKKSISRKNPENENFWNQKFFKFWSIWMKNSDFSKIPKTEKISWVGKSPKFRFWVELLVRIFFSPAAGQDNFHFYIWMKKTGEIIKMIFFRFFQNFLNQKKSRNFKPFFYFRT